MCGIIGITGNSLVASRILEGLKRLEYRGYDSAGIATLQQNQFHRLRAKGKLINLAHRLEETPLQGNIGIGHTRWATHGVPSEANAHPHATDRVVLVHNGIIENHAPLRQKLQDAGYTFTSETDTEVLVALIDSILQQGRTPLEAVQEALQQVHGSFAIAALFKDHPDLLIGARQGSPLVIGHGNKEMFIASDSLALVPFTNQITYLEEGEVVAVTPQGAKIFNQEGQPVLRKSKEVHSQDLLISKENFSHFMAKEIFEQPEVVQRTLNAFVQGDEFPQFSSLAQAFASVPKITIVACGTAFYASFVAKYWFEEIARIPVEIDIASEFRYRRPPLTPKGITILISQSGETADTLAAGNYAKEQGQYTVGIINVPESSLARLVDSPFYTLAGPEIGVASTKAFIAQLTTLASLALYLAEQRKVISRTQKQHYLQALKDLPKHLHTVLRYNQTIRSLAQKLINISTILYMGRGASYPMALEGALKMKELTYLHAEGYAAGEMKHGPIALVDNDCYVVVIAPSDHYLDKTISNMQEVMSRGGNILLIGDEKGAAKIAHPQVQTLILPSCEPFVSPFLTAIPVQLLAYHMATLKGTDVDQPRNLAKSVTVE